MKPKRNCWEAKSCGRAPGGANVAERGICPAAVEARLDGVHRGICGGRACWSVAGTLCGGEVQGTFAQKLLNCLDCGFYDEVATQEGPELLITPLLLSRLRE